MLRRSVVGILVMLAIPSWAANRVSVAQLEQTLSAMAKTHRTDAQAANEIGNLDPSERISNNTLERLTKRYASGPQSSIALQLLADRSSFLELPSSEVPKVPGPDPAVLEKLLGMARSFVTGTMPQLPNLVATRTTYSFDDSPEQVKKDGWPVRAGLHLVDIAKAEVDVQNEKESIVSGSAPNSQKPNGLETWGEFGTALLMVMDDSAKGTTVWSHWEQFPGGAVAVFNYSVPKSASHYEIEMPADAIPYRGEGESPRWLGVAERVTGSYGPEESENRGQMTRERPAYHGSLWMDPISGTILRITLIAEVDSNSNLARAATLIDYGSVQVGNASLVCPIRSIALSDAPPSLANNMSGATTEWLNENLFANYHLFASTSRILSQNTAGAAPNAASGESNPNSRAGGSLPETTLAASSAEIIQSSVSASATATRQEPPAPQMTEKTVPQAAPAAAPKQSASSTPGPPSPATEVAERPAVQSPLTALSPAPAVPPEIPVANIAPTFQVSVNAVEVPVVVRDPQGKSIDDLEKQEFVVLDDGKPRQLSGFQVERSAMTQNTAQSAATGQPAAEATNAPRMGASPGRFTVLVFDDLHLTFDQVAYAQSAAAATLDYVLAASDLAAVVTTSGKINSGLSSDRTVLIDAIRAVRPAILYRPDASECPKFNYYQANLIANVHDTIATADAVQQYMTACNPTAPGDHKIDLDANGSASPSVLPMMSSGDPLVEAAKISVLSTARLVLQRAQQDVLTTYATIGEFVTKLGKLPGQHNMILISPGFPAPDGEERVAESRLINLADEWGVTINALNAGGVVPTGLRASDDTGKIGNPILKTEYREINMQSEEDAVWELADGTGGSFFHNNNDLAAGFKMMEAPKTVYLLELSLDGVKQNGAWHRLNVKTDRAGLQVRARQGYFAPSKLAKHKAHAGSGSNRAGAAR